LVAFRNRLAMTINAAQQQYHQDQMIPTKRGSFDYLWRFSS